jgi:hypothetical protein
MSTVAAAVLLLCSGSGPAGSTLVPSLADPLDARDPARAVADAAGCTEDIARTAALLAGTPGMFPLRGSPLPVRLAFARPFALPEIAAWTSAPALAAGDRPYRAVAQFAARSFGVPCPSADARSRLEVSTPQRAVFALDFLLNESSLAVREALAAAMPEGDRARAARAAVATDVLSLPRGAQVPDPLAEAMRAAPSMDRAALVRAALHFDTALDVSGDWKAMEAEAEPLPEALAGAVEGTVLAAQEVPELGWIVVGGAGDNRYDMTRVAAVFDPSGNDRYDWGTGAPGGRLVVDAAGDDQYLATGGEPGGGPAGAACSVSVIDDFAGNDRYAAPHAALGTGVLGVGILVDRAGDDRYEGGTWSVAAAFGGIGALADLGGNDLYASDHHSQACGGPSGAALLLDAGGNDRYRADGSWRSAYGTPTVNCSFSQGCGFGYRIGASGGVGALVDAAGDDRYEGGEFAQGIGYFLSMGILRDEGGRDLYYGNRYAQGTAAHQAFGALLEGSGDDIYWSMTAAGQGAAWDMAGAALVDRAGDDRYQADGLSQGAAAQQAVAVLVDLAGRDDYRAAGASQGAADGNSYHWSSTEACSLGMLRDDEGPDRFSGTRRPGMRTATGGAGEPEGRTRWGIFLSR